MNPQLLNKPFKPPFKPPFKTDDGSQRKFTSPFQTLANMSLIKSAQAKEPMQHQHYETTSLNPNDSSIATRQVTPNYKQVFNSGKKNLSSNQDTIEKYPAIVKSPCSSSVNSDMPESNKCNTEDIKEIDSQIERLGLKDPPENSIENKENLQPSDSTTYQAIPHTTPSNPSILRPHNSHSTSLPPNKSIKFDLIPSAQQPELCTKKFTHPITNKTINITTEKKHDELFYEIIYTKKQRNKKSSDDGILVLTLRKFTLLDSKGKQISESPNMLKVRSFREGDHLTLGLREVEVIRKVSRDDFFSGRCFIQDFIVETEAAVPIKAIESIKIPEGALVLDPELHVYIEPFLAAKLRPHQREGVQFMYDSLAGKRVPGHFGCILADSMGLGKTLQAITLLYTLLRKDAQYHSFAKKGIIVSPATLVDNWKEEVAKWLGPIRLTPIICSGTGKQKKNLLKIFEQGPSALLIISYDTFVKHAESLGKVCQIIVCDEGHLLKNCVTQKNTSISSLACKRRILLSGTPLQNYLCEFYACVTLVNPGILGDISTFNKIFADPILKAQEPNASTQIRELAWGRSEELWRVTAQFVLRRTGSILETLLPPRNEYLIFCKCLPLQRDLYTSFLTSKIASAAIETGNGSNALALTSLLRKVVNHPDLVYKCNPECKELQEAWGTAIHLFPHGYISREDRSEFCTKVVFFDRIMQRCTKNNEKIVVVSSFTKTLDILQELCTSREYLFVRLDGSTLTKNRMRIVNEFNKDLRPMVFLLSSKAGGCGLNLIGANRLILFDPDWNPSNDKQAMGRIWRDGQKKHVYIYRLFLSGTIEEKIYQRQTAKENLSSTVMDAKKGVSKFSKEYLKEIFSFTDKCNSFEQGDDIGEMVGSELEVVRDLIDIAKKVQGDKDEVKEEQLDFTEAKHENIEAHSDVVVASGTKKKRK